MGAPRPAARHRPGLRPGGRGGGGRCVPAARGARQPGTQRPGVHPRGRPRHRARPAPRRAGRGARSRGRRPRHRAGGARPRAGAFLPRPGHRRHRQRPGAVDRARDRRRPRRAARDRRGRGRARLPRYAAVRGSKLASMDSVDIEVLRSAEAWRAAGQRVTLGTIVKTWGSAPRPVGALVVIRGDGQVVGSVSGGCVEDDLIDKVRTQAVARHLPQLLTYGVTNEEATRWGLPCGGTLQLVLEPVGEASALGELLRTVSRQQLVKRRLDMKSGRVTLEPGQWQDALEFDGETLITVHGPRWRLVLIGAGQLTQYLAEMARMLDYHVSVIEPREEYASGWNVAGVELDRRMPDDVIAALNLDGHSAVVALTHDPKIDDLALMEALKSAAFYVGAIGSKKNNDARRERLKEFDVSEGEIARLRGPVGLYIGSKTPPEIAVAILAEMTAVRHGVTEPSWAAKPARRFDPSACEVPAGAPSQTQKA